MDKNYKCEKISKNGFVPLAARIQLKANQNNCKICGNRPGNIFPKPKYLITENQSENYFISLLSEEGCFIRA